MTAGGDRNEPPLKLEPFAEVAEQRHESPRDVAKPDQGERQRVRIHREIKAMSADERVRVRTAFPGPSNASRISPNSL
jgi:hypothetical protein